MPDKDNEQQVTLTEEEHKITHPSQEKDELAGIEIPKELWQGFTNVADAYEAAAKYLREAIREGNATAAYNETVRLDIYVHQTMVLVSSALNILEQIHALGQEDNDEHKSD